MTYLRMLSNFAVKGSLMLHAALSAQFCAPNQRLHAHRILPNSPLHTCTAGSAIVRSPACAHLYGGEVGSGVKPDT